MIKVTPQAALAGHKYVVLHVDTDNNFDWLVEAYNDLSDAKRDAAIWNAGNGADKFVVAEINNELGGPVEYDCERCDAVEELRNNRAACEHCHITHCNDTDFEIQKLMDERWAAFAALRHVYGLLKNTDLTHEQILFHTQGFCDYAGLMEFS